MLDSAIKILKKLNDNNYNAYIVGGFVRDHLLGLKSNDIDITTNAKPKEILKLFEDAELSSKDYGTVTVTRNGYRFEITTFRKEINYKDHRHPDEIEYIDDLYEDLLRRDFTVNTICMDKDEQIIDLLEGRKDLNKKIIKTVGESDIRFKEDALRILRAIRFSTSLKFSLDKDIEKAIYNNKYLLNKISYNRKKAELDKIFTSNNSDKGIELLLKYDLDKELNLNRLSKVVPNSDLIGIWSILDVTDIYPFTSGEKDIIKKVNKALLEDYSSMRLYKYGLYVNSVIADIKGLDKKKVTEDYNALPIHTRNDLDITSEEIMKLLNKEPGGYLTEIYNDLIEKVLYRKIENKNNILTNYIITNYK
ncbi:MAG: hypothetical protein IJF92_03310 [Bacilli bacterium]|nr:hypothetical protein [Bacilli bacterium]